MSHVTKFTDISQQNTILVDNDGRALCVVLCQIMNGLLIYLNKKIQV